MALIESGPIDIKKGGVYTGLKIVTTSANQNAITISTYDPVEIYGNEFSGPGKAVHAYGGTKLNIHNNYFKGTKPADNEQVGRVVDVYHPQTFVFEHNIVEGTGGIRVDHMDENTKSAYIRYNAFINTDKRLGNGSEGDHRAAILFDGVVGIEGKIAWNYFENKPNESWIEDNINLRNSGGKKDNWFKIHDNYIKGAYPAPLSYNQDRGTNYTGSGITVEGDPDTNTYDKVAQYVHIYNNQVISTMNGGINVNHGHDHLVENNTIIASGQVNGIFYTTFWGGMSSWNGSRLNSSVYNNIVFKNNTVGYYRKGVFVGGTDRQDVVVEIKPENTQNVDPKLQISLPNPITQATEDAELVKWNGKLTTNKITIGPGKNGTVNPIPETGTIIGDIFDGIIEAKDGDKVVSYQTGSIIVTSNEYIKIDKDLSNEKKFVATAIKSGTGVITVTLITNSGKLLSQIQNVTIMDKAVVEEATSISITLTKR